MIGHYSESEKEQAFAILEELGLAEQAYKRCDALSGGQKQRVGIARAIMQQPKLILCDEPIASLDPKASKTIMDHLAQINQSMQIMHCQSAPSRCRHEIFPTNPWNCSRKIGFDGTPSELTQEKFMKSINPMQKI